MVDLSNYDIDFGYITKPLSEIPTQRLHTLMFNAGVDSTYILLGNVKRGGNEPYCYTEEKQCANRLCRVLTPERTITEAHVIRDDGTVWQINLKNFESVRYINVYDDRESVSYWDEEKRLHEWRA